MPFPRTPLAALEAGRGSQRHLLLEGYSARFTLGYEASVPPFRAAVTALLADDLDPAVGLRWFALGTAAAGSLWDDQATLDLSDRWEKMARAAGAFTTMPVALAFHAVSESMAGHFREADTRWGLMLEVLTMSSGPGVRHHSPTSPDAPSAHFSGSRTEHSQARPSPGEQGTLPSALPPA